MYLYLSKKIAMPNGTQLHSVAWNHADGWIAAGGANGLLKILQLDTGTGTTPAAIAMNQTLEGHTGWGEGVGYLGGG